MVVYTPFQQTSFKIVLAGDTISVFSLLLLLIYLCWKEMSKKQYARRLVMNLLLANLGFALTQISSAIKGVQGMDLGVPKIQCDAQGFFMMYWDQVLNIFALAVAVNLFMNVVYQKDLAKLELPLCAVAWIWPVVPSSIGYGVFGMNPGVPWCFVSVVGNGSYLHSVLPLQHSFQITACLIIIFLYSYVFVVIWKHTHRFTDSKMKSSTLNLLVYPFVHLLVYIPAFARRAYESNHPSNQSIQYLQFTMFAFQGVLNASVYLVQRGLLMKLVRFLSGGKSSKSGNSGSGNSLSNSGEMQKRRPSTISLSVV